MKVVQAETINGKAVTRYASFLGYAVYRWELPKDRDWEDHVQLIFVDSKGNVAGFIDIDADCGQNTGFISDIKLKETSND